MTNKKAMARTRRFTLRLSQEEYEKLEQKLKTTMNRDMSEYLRDLILERTVTMRYRNQSLDDFLIVALGLKNELNAIGRNINQAVKILHASHQDARLGKDIEFYEAGQYALQKKTEEIKSLLIQIHDQWSSK